MARKPGIKNNGKYKQTNQFEDGVEGVVRDVTGGGLFLVEILGKDGEANGKIVITKPSGKMKQNRITVTTGDNVVVQVSESDPRRGRITWRYR